MAANVRALRAVERLSSGPAASACGPTWLTPCFDYDPPFGVSARACSPHVPHRLSWLRRSRSARRVLARPSHAPCPSPRDRCARAYILRCLPSHGEHLPPCVAGFSTRWIHGPEARALTYDRAQGQAEDDREAATWQVRSCSANPDSHACTLCVVRALCATQIGQC